MSSLFGRLVGAHHVEDGAVWVLRKWLATYVHEIERGAPGETPGSIALPRSIRVSAEVEKMPEDQTPTVVVRSPGILDIPLANGARQYQAQFELEVGAVVSAIGTETNGSPRALRLARLYALALRACIVQQPDDDGYLFRRDWIDEQYDLLDSIDDRTICVGRTRFAIEVPDVLTSDAGPIEPLEPPEPPGVVDPESPEWPTAQTSDATVEKTPLDEDVTP